MYAIATNKGNKNNNIHNPTHVPPSLIKKQRNLIKRLNKHIRQNHHTRRIKNKHALHQRPGEFIPRRIAENQPEGEEGDGEEVPEEDHGALDEAAQEADGAVDEAEFKVAEAAALEGAEVLVFFFSLAFCFYRCSFIGMGRGGNRTICGKKRVKSLSEDINHRRCFFALPVKNR